MKKLTKLYLRLYIIQLIIIFLTVYPYMIKDWLMMDYFPGFLNMLYSNLYLYAYYIYTILILIIWTLPYILFIKKKKLTLKQIINKSIVLFFIFVITVIISRYLTKVAISSHININNYNAEESLFYYIIPTLLIITLFTGIVILVLFIIFKSKLNDDKAIINKPDNFNL